jgi:hypothetical protein
VPSPSRAGGRITVLSLSDHPVASGHIPLPLPTKNLFLRQPMLGDQGAGLRNGGTHFPRFDLLDLTIQSIPLLK